MQDATSTISKTVKKVWDDENNKYDERPASVKVQLYADGTAYGDPVTLTSDTNWTYTWNNLPKMSNGKEISYTATETTTVKGYEASYSDDTMTITNKDINNHSSNNNNKKHNRTTNNTTNNNHSSGMLNTGDTSGIVLYAGLFMTALLLLVVLLVLRRKVK